MSQAKPKQEQSINDLHTAFNQQIKFLISSIKSYDSGVEDEALRLSVHLRVLLHDTKASKSILKQLGVKQKIMYFDSAQASNPKNLFTEQLLVYLSIQGGRERPQSQYIPLCVDGPPTGNNHWIKFEDWWNTQAVIKDKTNYFFTRSKLVKTMANQEGGAHFDNEMDADYQNLVRHNSSNTTVEYSFNGESGSITPAYVAFASVRQIAFEFLEAVKKHKEKHFPFLTIDIPAHTML